MYKILLLLTVLCLLACDGVEDREVNCESVVCAVDQLIITYRDNDGNSLLGTVFIKDSFKLSSVNSVQYLKPVSSEEIENLAIFYEKIENNIDYILELSNTVLDTLNFTFSRNSNSCCPISTMEELLLNRELSSPESPNFYVFIK